MVEDLDVNEGNISEMKVATAEDKYLKLEIGASEIWMASDKTRSSAGSTPLLHCKR